MVGAAASVFAASIDPRATQHMDSAELVEMRAQALERLTAILSHALPTPVAPDLVLDAFTEASVN